MRPAPLVRARRLLGGTIVVYALLVATHLGEFWPFSIYPMFSQGGRTWTRAIVRDVSAVPDSLLWHTVSIDDLPGEAFPINPTGVNQNDVANFVAKSSTWNADRVAALRTIFGEATQERSLLVMRVQGRLVDQDEVEVHYTPFILLAPDTTRFNLSLELASN
ncbi:MAG: hypothetical protein SH809_17120 [Rhodothermales bacterium]|nr:hypothetical protein [Rhodothermales bacterium]